MSLNQQEPSRTRSIVTWTTLNPQEPVKTPWTGLNLSENHLHVHASTYLEVVVRLIIKNDPRHIQLNCSHERWSTQNLKEKRPMNSNSGPRTTHASAQPCEIVWNLFEKPHARLLQQPLELPPTKTRAEESSHAWSKQGHASCSGWLTDTRCTLTFLCSIRCTSNYFFNFIYFSKNYALFQFSNFFRQHRDSVEQSHDAGSQLYPEISISNTVLDQFGSKLVPNCIEIHQIWYRVYDTDLQIWICNKMPKTHGPLHDQVNKKYKF